MIEERLREAFARKEAEVPSGADLIERIDAVAGKRRRGRRLSRGGAAALVAVLVAVAAPALLGRAVGTVPSVQLGLSGVPAGPLNFLIAGRDRVGLLQEDPPAGKQLARADAILIAHVPADRGSVQLISIPRDLRVIDSERGPMKINATYVFGGIALLGEHVSELTGVTFNGTVEVDFAGLTALVDDIGGVSFCLDEETTSIHTGRLYPAGCDHYSGAQLRDLLRQRSYANGSLDRDRHNAQFFAAVARQLRGDGYLSDPQTLQRVYSDLSQYVRIDPRGLNPIELLWELRAAAESVSYASVQVKAGPVGDYDLGRTAAGLFAALRADTLADWIDAHSDDPLIQE